MAIAEGFDQLAAQYDEIYANLIQLTNFIAIHCETPLLPAGPHSCTKNSRAMQSI